MGRGPDGSHAVLHVPLVVALPRRQGGGPVVDGRLHRSAVLQRDGAPGGLGRVGMVVAVGIAV